VLGFLRQPNLRARQIVGWVEERNPTKNQHPVSSIQHPVTGGRVHASSIFFNISLTIPGFALPRVSFITCPTKNPINLVLPLRKASTSAGLPERTFEMISSMALESDI
jgi:hypothetical protein